MDAPAALLHSIAHDLADAVLAGAHPARIVHPTLHVEGRPVSTVTRLKPPDLPVCGCCCACNTREVVICVTSGIEERLGVMRS